MSDRDWFGFLRRVYFFKDLGDEDIRLIASSCAEEEYAPGDILFVEGATADRFYIIIEGRVEVWKNFYDPKPDLLAVHGPGHFFGEMALIDELPRSATVVAKDRARVLYLYRAAFRRLITERSSIALSVMTSISFMIRSSNELFVEDLRKRNDELEGAYSELERIQGERLRSERLSTLGKFSSLILHDIRNPLSILKGQLQLMELHLDDAEKLRAHIRAGLAEVGRLERLAAEFLDYSRGEMRLELAPTTPRRILERLADAQRERLSAAGIAVEIEASWDEPLLLDEERMLRALHNVVDNARKAMPRGGTIRLGARREGERLVLEAADTGEGMGPDILDHVFEPFFSASGKGGTGLGMLIVKNIVEAHGGKVEIASERGKGTEVRFSLPLRA